MRLFIWLRGGAVALASLGILLPQAAFGVEGRSPLATRTSEGPTFRDVALQAGGVLRGQVLDAQGTPVTETKVVLGQQGQAIAETRTDGHGRFGFSGLKGGVYQLATSQGGGLYRAWAVGTAPPAASADALVINGDTVVRGALGEHHDGSWFHFLANPWVLGGIVAAAIAIPLAIDNDEGS